MKIYELFLRFANQIFLCMNLDCCRFALHFQIKVCDMFRDKNHKRDKKLVIYATHDGTV